MKKKVYGLLHINIIFVMVYCTLLSTCSYFCEGFCIYTVKGLSIFYYLNPFFFISHIAVFYQYLKKYIVHMHTRMCVAA